MVVYLKQQRPESVDSPRASGATVRVGHPVIVRVDPLCHEITEQVKLSFR